MREQPTAFASLHEMVGTDTLVHYRQFAAIVGMHPTTLRRALRRGELKYARVSARTVLIPTSQMTAELAQHFTDKAAGLREYRGSQVVYFIGAGETGPIKIGIASDLKRRLFELQQTHYEPLTILAVAEGGMKLERELHRRFQSARIRGEWFTRTPEILAEIASHLPAVNVEGLQA